MMNADENKICKAEFFIKLCILFFLNKSKWFPKNFNDSFHQVIN
jgi:hypothetical protein